MPRYSPAKNAFSSAPDEEVEQALLAQRRLEVVKKLGLGGSGAVTKVRTRASRGRRGQLYAAKITTMPARARAGRHVLQEVHMHKLAEGSPYISRLVDFWGPHVEVPPADRVSYARLYAGRGLKPRTRDPEHTYGLLFALADCDLGRVCRAYVDRGRRAPEAFAWSVLRHGLAPALAHLAARGLVHADMAARNVLLDFAGVDPASQYPRALLADFGSASCVAESKGKDKWAARLDAYVDVRGAAQVLHSLWYGRTACWCCMKETLEGASEELNHVFVEARRAVWNASQNTEGWATADLLAYVEEVAPRMIRDHFEPLAPWSFQDDAEGSDAS